MNPDQKLWIRITQSGVVTEQAVMTDFRSALHVIHDSFITLNGRKVVMNIELSNSELKDSLLNREQQAEQQLLANALDNKDEIIYEPDVTLHECEEAWSSEVGKLMFKFQRPESRIGVDPEALQQIRKRYESEFPRVAPHGPKWAD